MFLSHHMLLCKHHATRWNMKWSKKMDAEPLLGNNTPLRLNLCINVLWEEGFDKLINLYFLLPKSFLHSSPTLQAVAVGNFSSSANLPALGCNRLLFGGQGRRCGEESLFPWGRARLGLSRCWGLCLTPCSAEHWVPSGSCPRGP